MILLNHKDYDSILKHCAGSAPDEACGLLGGRIDGEIRTVERVYMLTNTDHSPEHFSMDPKEQFAAIKDMRNNGLVLLGNFHSHPASPSRPSKEDIRLAFDPEASYTILSMMEKGKPVLKSFRVQKGIVSEEEVRITGGKD